MNLYIVRHGQSVANLQQRHSGWTMLPLTEQGFEDARRAGRLIRGIQFDRVYSSDLTRAVQTARTALPDREPEQIALIRERNVGCLMERLVTDCYAEYGDVYRDARARLDFSAFGGESEAQVAARANAFLNQMAAEDCENIVAFSHAGFIESTIEQVLGLRVDRSRLRTPNGTVVKLHYDGDHWRLVLGTDFEI